MESGKVQKVQSRGLYLADWKGTVRIDKEPLGVNGNAMASNEHGKPASLWLVANG